MDFLETASEIHITKKNNALSWGAATTTIVLVTKAHLELNRTELKKLCHYTEVCETGYGNKITHKPKFIIPEQY